MGSSKRLWATLLMYNLIRLEITRIADEAKVQPCRISFITALRYIVDEWLWSSGSHTPGAIPTKLAAMRRTSAASCCRLADPTGGIRVRFV